MYTTSILQQFRLLLVGGLGSLPSHEQTIWSHWLKLHTYIQQLSPQTHEQRSTIRASATDTHTNIYIRCIYHCSYRWPGRNSKVLSQHCTNINHLTACNERRLLVIFSCQLLTWDNNSLTIVVMIQQTGSGSPSGERTWSRDEIQPLAAKQSPTCNAVCTSADSWIALYVITKTTARLTSQANQNGP